MAEPTKNQNSTKAATQTPAPAPAETPTAVAPQEAATPPEPAPQYVTFEQAQKMAEAAADKAAERTAKILTAALAAQKQVPAPAPQHILVAAAPEKKPVKPTRAAVPPEFWVKDAVTFFHEGSQHSMDAFYIDGRAEPPPRSILIHFTELQGANIKRFGDSTQISYLCKYTTHDSREIELFRKDIRFGTEIWDESGKPEELEAQVELGWQMGRRAMSLSGENISNLRQMAVDRGLTLSNDKNILARSIASHDVRKEAIGVAQKAAERLAEASKELELSKR